MKIKVAFATDDGKIFMDRHFGDAEYYDVYEISEIDSKFIKRIKNTTEEDNESVHADPEKAKGQKELIKSCPYGAIFWNEEKNVPQKCTLCSHLLDAGWKQPRCVQVCPTGALKIIKTDDSEMLKQIKNENLKILSPEHNTRPRVYYKNLHRFERCFIAGSVSVKVEDMVDCAQGANVVLKKNDLVLAQMHTDNYGDFKFDNIEPDKGVFQIEVAYKNFEIKAFTIEVTKSRSLRDIVFE